MSQEISQIKVYPMRSVETGKQDLQRTDISDMMRFIKATGRFRKKYICRKEVQSGLVVSELYILQNNYMLELAL